MPIEFTHVPGESAAGSSTNPFFRNNLIGEARLARIEDSGFHSVVIDDPAGPLASLDLAARTLDLNPSLDVIMAHAAGVIDPVEAARHLAALDQKSGGRLSLLMVSGPLSDQDAESRPAGHAAIWQRIDEYLVLLKRLWSNDGPFDHEGAFYSIKGGYVPDKDRRGVGPTIRIGGLSGTALKVAARHADVFELPAGSPEEVGRFIGRVRAAAADYGRAEKIRFALPVQIGGTATAEPDRHPVTASGTPAQIALALLPHALLGVGEFMISGADTQATLKTLGRETLRLLRNSASRHHSDGIEASPLPYSASRSRAIYS